MNQVSSLNGAAGDAGKSAGCTIPMTPKQAENRGLLWVVASFAFCPCHLPLTLAWMAALLSGTAAGMLLRNHPFIAGTLITAVWAAGTWRGFAYFRAAERYARALRSRSRRGPLD